MDLRCLASPELIISSPSVRSVINALLFQSDRVFGHYALCFRVVFLDDWSNFSGRVDERCVCFPMHGLSPTRVDRGSRTTARKRSCGSSRIGERGADAQLRFAGAMFWLMWKRLSGS